MARFFNFEDAYKTLFSAFVSRAKRRLMNKSVAQDVVQDVFIKALDYKIRFPDSSTSGFILFRNLVIACKKANKEGKVWKKQLKNWLQS